MKHFLVFVPDNNMLWCIEESKLRPSSLPAGSPLLDICCAFGGSGLFTFARELRNIYAY